jgi:hypothetical protein
VDLVDVADEIAHQTFASLSADRRAQDENQSGQESEADS